MEKVIKTVARIDANTVNDFETEIMKGIEETEDVLVIDMENTVYICSSGLRIFLSSQKKFRGTGKNMVIRNVKPQIMEIFEVTGFSGILNFEY